MAWRKRPRDRGVEPSAEQRTAGREPDRPRPPAGEPVVDVGEQPLAADGGPLDPPSRVCLGCGQEGAAFPVNFPIRCPRCGAVSHVPQEAVDKKTGMTAACSNTDCGLTIDIPASIWCPECRLNLRHPATIAALIERANADAAEAVAAARDERYTERVRDADRVRDVERAPDADGGRAQRTHVVDCRREGDYGTIGEAVRAAAPGDRILVRPGVYHENVVLDKPLELVGDGSSGDVLVESSGGPALEFQAETGRVANLALRGSGDGANFGVDIRKGRLQLEDCDITTTGMSGVIIDYGADPRLRRNHIHDARQAGVLVTGEGRGVIEDNEICRNGHAGVAISKGANPTLRRNRIHSGGECGVQVYERGRGLLEDNEIVGNTRAGVEVDSGANPTLRGNRIRDGKQSGVFVHGQGLGVLEDNDITANTYVGVAVTTGGNPAVRGNRISDNQESGVHVYDNGLGTFEENEITASGLNGVTVRTGGSPVVRGNDVRDSKVCGIYVYDNGLGVYENNRITRNASFGVRAKTGGSPVVRGNTIGASEQCGVYVSNNGLGVFEDNEITASGLSGVIIDTGGAPAIRANRIREGKQCGVYAYDNGRGVVQDNQITGNTGAGIEISTGARLVVRGNTVTGNGGSGIRVHDEGGGRISSNWLTGNTHGAWSIASDCEPNVVREDNEDAESGDATPSAPGETGSGSPVLTYAVQYLRKDAGGREVWKVVDWQSGTVGTVTWGGAPMALADSVLTRYTQGMGKPETHFRVVVWAGDRTSDLPGDTEEAEATTYYE